MNETENRPVYAPATDAETKELTSACQRNGWLMRGGYDWQDDPYLEDYPYEFCRAESIEDLTAFMAQGNWAIRQGILYEDLAFINQVNGGDEWWALKRTDDGWLGFESASCALVIERDPAEFAQMVACMNAATPEQCEHLDYMEVLQDSLDTRAGSARAASAALENPHPDVQGKDEVIK